MSGPKDYSYTFDAARALMQATRRLEQMKRRDEALRRRAQENQQRLNREMVRLAEQRAELNRHRTTARSLRSAQIATAAEGIAMKNSDLKNVRDAELQLAADANRAKLATLQKLPKSISARDATNANSSETVDSQLEKSSPVTDELPITPSDAEGERDDEAIRGLILEALKWKEEMLADADVADFQGTQSTEWRQKCHNILNLPESVASDGFRDAIVNLVTQAQGIHAAAGELAVKFNTRNELVSDIIDSLKEVGFVVDDPQFADPANPSGVVLLVANRGNERMEASVDLSEEIRSTWNNLTGEHCKTAFFDYVDAMSSKGVKVKPHREDLQNRPIKRQQGAKDLPRSKTENS